MMVSDNGDNRRIGNGLDLNACNDHSMIQARLRDPRWDIPEDVKVLIRDACVDILKDDGAKGRLRLHAGQTLMAMERQNQVDEIEGEKIHRGVGQAPQVVINQYVDENGGPVTDYLADEE